MCSSPKSSGTVRRSRLKGVFEDMDPSTRASFVTKANAAADKRSELQNQAAKRKQISSGKGLAKRATSKKQPPVKENFLLSFLQRMGYAV
jgi:hypothetical protein